MSEGLTHNAVPFDMDNVPVSIQVAESRCYHCGHQMRILVPAGMTNHDAQTKHVEDMLRNFAFFCQEETGRNLLREWNLSLMHTMAVQAGIELTCREVEESEERTHTGEE